MNYRYSIIVPHYNDTKRLERLLHSIPHERSDIEVLVIDDCSPNQEKIKDLEKKTPWVKWYSTEQNLGAGHARNIGLKNANGKFLIFADSDDQFTDDAFDHIDNATMQEIDLCYFLADAVQEIDLGPSNRADLFNQLCLAYINKDNAEHLAALKSGHVVPWAKVYDRAFIKKTGLTFDEIRFSNDVTFNVLAAFEAKKVQVVPKKIYRIFRRGGSLTANASAEAFLMRLGVEAQLATRLKEQRIAHRPSSTGALLTSIRYGPKVFLKVLIIAIKSDLKFEPLQIFNLRRWYAFISKRYKTKKELSKNK